MATNKLDGTLFKSLLTGSMANLHANVKIVNDLNVFPIPDGDTGDNMCMTISGGVRAVENETSISLEKISSEVSSGMLMSARGNSGVILSQFFFGVSEGFKGLDSADVGQVASAFQSGVKKAYKAVITPTEGTMLTVVREATDYASSRVGANSTIDNFLSDFIKEANASLERTPELLSVLKEAGVVDSGGAGIVYIAEGMQRALRGEIIESGEIQTQSVAEIDLSKFDENSEMEYGYCTEFLLRLQTKKVDVENFDIAPLVKWLESIGDSIVAVKNGSIVKVHVHTMTPGEVFNHCQQYGEFLTLKVENMTLQHSETTIENRFARKDTSGERKPFALVTVATGKGMTEAFKELHADVVIDGGQCQNPSTEDFIKAFDEANADVIFVLPNNSNIIMAAKQAGDMYKSSRIIVVESKSIGEGYAAVSMLDYDSGDAEQIAQGLREAMEGVVTGEVTKSVRDANLNGVDIKKGNYIGFIRKEMLASEPTKNATAFALLEKIAGGHEILIAIFGSDVTLSEKDEFRAHVSSKYPMTELYEIEGGQDVYDYILVLE